MESNLHLLLTQPCCCCCFFIIPPLPQTQLRQLKSHNLCFHHLRFSFITTSKYRNWHSNAETFRTKRFKRFNQDQYEYEDEDEEEEENSSRRRKRQRWSNESGILEQVIDNVWIFKVFKSYGWFFPVIIFSLLLATGLKAFLIALAFPLGQSVLSLAFEKFWGRTQIRSKRKTKTRKKPSANTVSNVEMEEEQQEESQGTRKAKMGYQSWVGGDDGSVDNGGQEIPSFGGWEELDRMRSMRGSSGKMKGSRRRPVEKSKLSRSGRSDTPLLLRLLIAVFPFLSSWTKML